MNDEVVEVVPGFIMAILQMVTTPTYVADGWGTNSLPEYWATELVTHELATIDADKKIRSTPKADKYVQMLCDTPLPVSRWVDPR